jgi:RimJ/RimL family protein N-acetyltransferase
MDIPTLTTDRLVLRAFNAGDWGAYAAMNADPAVREWLGGAMLSREQAWAQLETFLGQWALRVGLLHFAEWPEPELAWTIASPLWGRGLTTEAAAEVRRWWFGALGRDRLVSFIWPENVRSQRVAKKLGAVRDGGVVLRGFAAEVWVHPPPGRGVVV